MSERRRHYARSIKYLKRPVNGTSIEQNEVPRRRPLGGRGREWAHACHKLLENMMELEDSEPFRDPVNLARYQDYFSKIDHPMDLNKVMFNFHSGKYASPHMFEEDVQLIFSNSEKFFTSPESKIFHQTLRLKWWFSQQFKDIKDAYFCRHSNKKLRTTNSPNTAASMSSSAYDAVPTIPALMSKGPNAVDPQTNGYLSLSSLPLPNGNMSLLSAAALSSTSLGNKKRPAPSEERFESQSVDVSHSPPVSPPPPVHPPSALQKARRHSNGVINASKQVPSPTPADAPSNDLFLECNATWFGTNCSRMKARMTVTENTIQIPLKNPSQENHQIVNFTIHGREIIKAMVYFGKSKRHNLALVLSPNAERRLRNFILKHNLAENPNTPEAYHCILMHLKPLSTLNQSRMIHILWNMGHKGLYGSILNQLECHQILELICEMSPKYKAKAINRANKSKPPKKRSLESIVATLTDRPSISRDNSLDSLVEDVMDPTTLSLHDSSCKLEISDDEDLRIISPGDSHSAPYQESHVPGSGSPVDQPGHPPVDPGRIHDQPPRMLGNCTNDEIQISMASISMKCPITQTVMKEPVRNVHCGHSYDKPGVEELIRQRQNKAKCPFSGCSNDRPLLLTDLAIDHHLQGLIQQYQS